MSVADTAVVALRESLEALLIIGILAGMVTKLGRPEAKRPIYAGALSALALSIVLGVIFFNVAEELFEDFETEFEVIASLLAVAILTYMVVWMYKHTQHGMGILHDKTKAAIEGDRKVMLWGLAFVVVIREGIETVLFIATQASGTTPGQAVFGVLLGFLISAVLAILLFRGVLKLNIERFFLVTGVFLIVVAGGLLGYATHEAEEIGWIPATPDAWDWSGWMPHKCGDDVTVGCAAGSLLGGIMSYRATPSWVDLGAWFVYVGALSFWYLRPQFGRPHRADEKAHATEGDP